MNPKKECLLVTELLPLYLEKQTGKHINEYIEAHIKNCNECQKLLKYMSESYGEAAEHRKPENQKLLFKKIKKRIFVVYLMILIIVWIFIFVCFM